METADLPQPPEPDDEERGEAPYASRAGSLDVDATAGEERSDRVEATERAAELDAASRDEEPEDARYP